MPSPQPIEAAKVRLLYAAGLSTRQVAARLGIGKSRVHVLVQDISRTQSEAVHLRTPASSNHWRSARSAARRTMERHLRRKLESWEHVHHIDEDYTNRALSNLEVLVDQVHYDLHFPYRQIPYEQRESRRKYKRSYNAQYSAAKLQRMSAV